MSATHQEGQEQRVPARPLQCAHRDDERREPAAVPGHHVDVADQERRHVDVLQGWSPRGMSEGFALDATDSAGCYAQHWADIHALCASGSRVANRQMEARLQGKVGHLFALMSRDSLRGCTRAGGGAGEAAHREDPLDDDSFGASQAARRPATPAIEWLTLGEVMRRPSGGVLDSIWQAQLEQHDGKQARPQDHKLATRAQRNMKR